MNHFHHSDGPAISDPDNAEHVARRRDRERIFYQDARSIVRDLFQPKPALFWMDFILSTIFAYVLASLFLALPMTQITTWSCFFAAAVLIYRASMFIHEIVHLPHGRMRGFRFAWNLFAGVPMMIPSFTYRSHRDHHNAKHFGSHQDGEYLPLANGGLAGLITFGLQVFFQPILVFFRYLVLTPISFLHPVIRKWVVRHATSLVINFRYENTHASSHNWTDTFWELFTTFRAWVMIGLVLSGVMPWVRLPKILLLAVFVLVLNHLRTLAAHRYTNDGTTTLSHLEQFQDSTNIQGNWLTELMCPLGLRYHALHHLFPGIPYHSLGIAHRRLIQQLPNDSIYHEASCPSIYAAIRQLLTKIRQH